MTDRLSRRSYLTTVLGVSATALGSGTAMATDAAVQDQSSQRPAADCPMLRYDPSNNAVRPNGDGPSEAVDELWRFDTDGGLYSQPVVADGTVYVTSTDQTVYAVDGSSGNEQWRVGTNTELRATPAVTKGLVVIPTNNRLLAVSAANGAGEWKSQKFSNTRSLTVTQSGGSAQIYVVSDGNDQLRRVNAVTGDIVWQVALPGRSDGLTNAPAVANGHLYDIEIGEHVHDYRTQDHAYLKARSTEDGSEQWTSSLGHDLHKINNRLTYSEGSIYIGTSKGVGRRFDAETGEQSWAISSIDSVNTYPVHANSLVYFATNEELVAVDPSIGTKRWSVSLSGKPTSPVYVDGTLYLGSTDNNMYAYDAETGEQNWNFSIGSSIKAPPVVTDDIIYVSSTDGSLYALSKTDATPTGPDVTGDGNPAQDLDGDGLYEDVNGDGSFTIVDVQALFANLDSDAVQQNADLFDFNGDGEVNVSDVQTLYSKLQ
jgi:outer membrane protein assembly factor BamB